MAKRKFKKRPFRDWLDGLAKIIVKTRANFTCEIGVEGCTGRMMPLDKNCQWCHIKSRNSNNWRWSPLNALCGCGHCHQWIHANPNEWGVLFSELYPIRNVLINMPISNHPWYEKDYRDMESRLLQIAVIYKVDYMNMPVRFRARAKAKMKDLKT